MSKLCLMLSENRGNVKLLEILQMLLLTAWFQLVLHMTESTLYLTDTEKIMLKHQLVKGEQRRLNRLDVSSKAEIFLYHLTWIISLSTIPRFNFKHIQNLNSLRATHEEAALSCMQSIVKPALLMSKRHRCSSTANRSHWANTMRWSVDGRSLK